MAVKTTVEENKNVPSILNARWFWLLLIGLVLILGGAWIALSQTLIANSVAAGGAVNLEPAPVAGHPAPNFELKGPEGETVRLSDYKGKAVILNFWATWCAPCRAEFPDFQKASVDNADKLVIIGVNNTSTDQAELVPDFLAEFGVTFPIALDETGETAKTYRILGLPTTIFIDSNGIINEVFTGPLNKAYIEAKLAELL